MENSKYGNLIRTGNQEILSCTIKKINEGSSDLSFLDIYFRDAVEKKCGILFYKYEKRFYYPLSMEFRLIDNNVLFLLNELKISNFDELALLLTSSFKREEEREVDFFAVIQNFDHIPKNSILIPELNFKDTDEVIEVQYGQ